MSTGSCVSVHRRPHRRVPLTHYNVLLLTEAAFGGVRMSVVDDDRAAAATDDADNRFDDGANISTVPGTEAAISAGCLRDLKYQDFVKGVRVEKGPSGLGSSCWLLGGTDRAGGRRG